MLPLSKSWPHGIFIFFLLLAALWFPLPLYLGALAIFGLPHVIWELAFIRSRYAKRWPLGWWWALWGVLLMQALSRTALWLGKYPAESSQIIDLLTLALLGFVLVFSPKNTGWRIRMFGLLIAAGVLWLLEQGNILTALLVLAVAHNFTPLAFVWDMAREHSDSRKTAWIISGLLLLPILVACSGWTGGLTPDALTYAVPLLDGQLPKSWDGAYRQALLSGIVLAQCLHYYCVIYLLPRAESRRTMNPLMTRSLQLSALILAGLLSAYFIYDYSAARKLYAVAAGAHAWLEWPVILLAFLCATRG
jgi:hypothetical protein